jgi:hypothetical protein
MHRVRRVVARGTSGARSEPESQHPSGDAARREERRSRPEPRVARSAAFPQSANAIRRYSCARMRNRAPAVHIRSRSCRLWSRPLEAYPSSLSGSGRALRLITVDRFLHSSGSVRTPHQDAVVGRCIRPARPLRTALGADPGRIVSRGQRECRAGSPLHRTFGDRVNTGGQCAMSGDRCSPRPERSSLAPCAGGCASLGTEAVRLARQSPAEGESWARSFLAPPP